MSRYAPARHRIQSIAPYLLLAVLLVAGATHPYGKTPAPDHDSSTATSIAVGERLAQTYGTLTPSVADVDTPLDPNAQALQINRRLEARKLACELAVLNVQREHFHVLGEHDDVAAIDHDAQALQILLDRRNKTAVHPAHSGEEGDQ